MLAELLVIPHRKNHLFFSLTTWALLILRIFVVKNIIAMEDFSRKILAIRRSILPVLAWIVNASKPFLPGKYARIHSPSFTMSLTVLPTTLIPPACNAIEMSDPLTQSQPHNLSTPFVESMNMELAFMTMLLIAKRPMTGNVSKQLVYQQASV